MESDGFVKDPVFRLHAQPALREIGNSELYRPALSREKKVSNTIRYRTITETRSGSEEMQLIANASYNSKQKLVNRADNK
jgi:hypothetical protein